MKLIVGLGNPETKYNFTRHNFGFLALDFYTKVHDLNWQKPQMNALWFKTDDTIFIKPQTYYNESGQAVQAFSHFYKIPPENILVVCDDLDLNFGTIRLRLHGSSGGNNGLKSIISHLGTENFLRLRLGTHNPTVRTRLSDVDFVLGHFTPDEKSALPDLLPEISQKISDFIAQ